MHNEQDPLSFKRVSDHGNGWWPFDRLADRLDCNRTIFMGAGLSTIKTADQLMLSTLSSIKTTPSKLADREEWRLWASGRAARKL